MRFNSVIQLINQENINDGLGGRTEVERVISNLNANIIELGIEATYKIYGAATVDAIKAICLGKISYNADKIKYNNKYYKIISKRFVKNKTCYLLEVIDND